MGKSIQKITKKRRSLRPISNSLIKRTRIRTHPKRTKSSKKKKQSKTKKKLRKRNKNNIPKKIMKGGEEIIENDLKEYVFYSFHIKGLKTITLTEANRKKLENYPPKKSHIDNYLIEHLINGIYRPNLAKNKKVGLMDYYKELDQHPTFKTSLFTKFEAYIDSIITTYLKRQLRPPAEIETITSEPLNFMFIKLHNLNEISTDLLKSRGRYALVDEHPEITEENWHNIASNDNYQILVYNYKYQLNLKLITPQYPKLWCIQNKISVLFRPDSSNNRISLYIKDMLTQNKNILKSVQLHDLIPTTNLGP
jgi:hypothetical protein